MLANSKDDSIVVNPNRKKFWSNGSNYAGYRGCTFDELLDAIGIILFHTYTELNGCIFKQIHSWQKKVVTPQLKTIKPMWIELLCFHLAEIGMIWARDCSPTKSDTTLGRHSMQDQVGSSSTETTV